MAQEASGKKEEEQEYANDDSYYGICMKLTDRYLNEM
jgi:hypothetical protein